MPVVTPQIPTTTSSRTTFNAPVLKKKSNPMLVLTVAAIVGCIAMGSIRMFSAAKPAETVTIVCAANDIPAGCKLSYSNLHYMTVPKRYATTTMFQSYEQLVGKYSRTFIPAREPFTSLTLISNSHGLSGEVPKGLRALTLKLTEDAAVDAQVRPGDRVDVVATTPYKTKKYTKTIAENLLVMLSMPKETLLSEKFRGDENSKVTVAVNPAQAEVLSEAMDNSKLRLTLRSYGDISRAVLSGSDERDLLTHYALREEPVVAAAPVVVRRDAIEAPPLPPVPVTPEQVFTQAFAPVVQEPARWVVEMFSGSKREMTELQPRQ